MTRLQSTLFTAAFVAGMLAHRASAQPATAASPPPSAAASPGPAELAQADTLGSPSWLSKLQVHGFVSAGGFVSSANEYIGTSTRGSLKLFETGINITVEPIDRLRAGLQLVFRSVGTLSEDVPRVDWAVLDYRFQPWLSMRAGVIKMPLGLYNEFVDIDSARTAILMPQSLYPLRNRDALISHTGFAAYGNIALAGAGDLDYQAWLGTLSIPKSALELDGASLDSVDTRYVAGGQVFWRAPLEGLRFGATYLRASIDFDLSLDADVVTQLKMADLLPAEHDGSLTISQRPTGFWVVSAEYSAGDWLIAAEYSRWLKRQLASLPELIPTTDEDAERFYALISYRISPLLELGTYYSVTHADVNDRSGDGDQFERHFHAFQRDLTASVRIDVNEYWLWKVEGHFIDGTADLSTIANPNPKRTWGLFLFRTTVTF